MRTPLPQQKSSKTGRASTLNPAGRFDRLALEIDPAYDSDSCKTEFFVDNTKDILAKNDSPDVSFDFSINPYRGCEHGCIYCYARPTHEYFGLSCGLDFETKILVKKNAPELLEKRFRSSSWMPQLIALSGNTDCYQPAEKELRITRKCLAVFLKYRNPVGIITKSALVTRDLDLLQDLAKHNLVAVTVSVTTLDNQLARKMEPRASSPANRLDALEQLSKAGIPANVNVAPVIPGLTDHEMPAILKEAANRGVRHAAYILMRLPFAVKELVQGWLEANYPDRVGKVLNSVRTTRDGELNDPKFKSRMSGTGARADAIRAVFKVCCKKYGLNDGEIELETKHFRRGNCAQQELF